MNELLLLSFVFFSFFTKAEAACSVTISASGPTTFCQGDSVILSAVPNGTGPYVCSWSNGEIAFSIVVKTSGTYTVSITDASSCSATSAPVVVKVNPLPTISSPDKVICYGQTVTALTASGGGSCNCLWSTGQTGCSITVSPTMTTTYSVQCTDFNGCKNMAVPKVTLNPPLIITILPSNPTVCPGNCTTITATGATSYIWSPSSLITATPTFCLGGTYCVKGTDANGCTSIVCPVVSVIAPIQAPIITCVNDSLHFTPIPGYLYQWFCDTSLILGATDSIYIPKTSCNYRLSLTNTVSGCTATSTAPSCYSNACSAGINSSGPTTFCQGGSVSLIAAATGTPPYLYSWSNGQTTSSINVTSSGIYTVSITDFSSCTSTSIPVSVNANPLPVLSTSDTTVCSGSPATITVSGGSNYSWANGETTSSITVTIFSATTLCTTYTVWGSDSNGCTANTVAKVCVNPLPLVKASPDQTICQGESTILTSSGVIPCNCSWSTGQAGICSITVTPPVSTGYIVTCTDTNGCSNSDTVAVNVTSPYTTVSSFVTVCNGNPVILTAGGATTYLWSTGQTGSSITLATNPTTTTTYSVMGTTSGGCTSTNTVTVSVPFAIGPPSAICVGSSTFLVAIGGPLSTYSWTDPLTLTDPLTNNPTANPTTTTTYSVYITDVNGCTTVIPVTVTVISCQTVIEENNDISGIRLFPNPFSNSSVLIVPDELRNGSTRLFIYDVLGNRLSTIPIEKEQTVINRRDLASGIYFYLIMKDEKRIYSGKMVVE